MATTGALWTKPHIDLSFDINGQSGAQFWFQRALEFEMGSRFVDFPDLTGAVSFYRQAVARGHVHAMYNLGVLLARGRGGVKKDVPAAVDLYQKPVASGYARAKNNLALLLACGEDGDLRHLDVRYNDPTIYADDTTGFRARKSQREITTR